VELNPLNQIDPITVALTIVVFIATYWLMRKVFFDKTIAVMEAREVRCHDAEEACRRAQAVIAQAEHRAEETAAATHDEAEALITRTREEAEEEKVSLLAQARQQAEARLQEGRTEVLAAREREITSLRTEAIECVGLACEKLAGHANPDVIDSVVDRFVNKTLQ